MNTKIAALFLLALLAFGVTGFASAWWTAELKVTGTVTTGTFGMEWSLDHYVISNDTKHIITGTGVALADYIGTHPQTLAIDLHDVYPCTDLEIWCDIHYYGSVPGNISSIDFVGTLNGIPLTNFTNWMFDEVKITDISPELLAQNPHLFIGSIWKLPYTDPAQVFGDIQHELIGLQWHSSYHINFEIYIHWTEYGMHFWDPWGVYWYENRVGAEVPQGATLAFTITFNVVQYNSPP